MSKQIIMQLLIFKLIIDNYNIYQQQMIQLNQKNTHKQMQELLTKTTSQSLQQKQMINLLSHSIDCQVKQKQMGRLEINRLTAQVKLEVRQHTRTKNLMAVKEQMIKNYQWEKKIFLKQKKQLEHQLKDLKQSNATKANVVSNIGSHSSSQVRSKRIADLQAINCQSFDDSINVSEVEFRTTDNMKKYFIQKRKENSSQGKELAEMKIQMAHIKKYINQIQQKLMNASIDKQRIEKELYLVKITKKESHDDEEAKKQKKSQRHMKLLAQKCWSLQKQIQKLTMKLLGQERKQDRPNQSSSQSNTNIFPKNATRLFSSKRQSESNIANYIDSQNPTINSRFQGNNYRLI